MMHRVPRRVFESLGSQDRDIALIAAPGMGLSTLLQHLGELDHIIVARLDVKCLTGLWDQEYKKREQNRRFVIHAATLRALEEAKHLSKSLSDEELYRTNLPRALSDPGQAFRPASAVYVVIDDFDEVSDDLAVVVLNELKALDDNRTLDSYLAIRPLRYIIGGSIDFRRLYFGSAASGVSPATNFIKCPTSDFLWSHDEATRLVETSFPGLVSYPKLLELILDWAGGYLHYILEFSRLALKLRGEVGNLTTDALLGRLKAAIEDREPLPLLRYCESAWETVKGEKRDLELLQIAISAGYVSGSDESCRRLANLGYLIETAARRNLLRPINKVVEVFIRQRLAERQLAMPIEQSAVWTMPQHSASAYQTIMAIENHLRNYIGDTLLRTYKGDWLEEGLGKTGEESSSASVLDRARKRQQQEQKEPYVVPDVADALLVYLDFADLSFVVKQMRGVIPDDIVDRLPPLLEELNFYRRRIAHSRLVTPEQIDTLEGRWQIVQKMLARQNGLD